MNIYIRNERTGSTTLNNILPKEKTLVFGHFSLKHILSLWSSHSQDCITGPLTSPRFDECFSFTFVRNPWTRLYSLFTFDSTVKEYNPKTFEEWVMLKPSSWWLKYSQHRYTHVDGQQKIKKIYYYENYFEEVNKLFLKLGCECPKDTSKYITNGRQNLRPKNYNAFYHPKVKSYVNEKMLADIEIFGYRFEDINEKN